MSERALLIHSELATYCQGFTNAWEAWPPLPLPEPPELAWWDTVLSSTGKGELQGQPLLNALETALPQLRLPQREGISRSDLYKALVLRGEPLDAASIAAIGPPPHWQHPEAIRLWIAPHPCGRIPVLQTPSGSDFVQLVRALAHRGEPIQLAEGVHAQAVTGLIHWGLIHQFGHHSRARLIVLHEAPYGSVPASAVPGGLNEGQWLSASTTLRLEHELTHLATKRLLGEMRLNLLDELIADCMGMVAALGWFNADLFGRCLGIDAGRGRWITYTAALSEKQAQQALNLVMIRARELERILIEQPQLLQPEQALARLQWLCQQRLDQPIRLLAQADVELMTYGEQQP